MAPLAACGTAPAGNDAAAAKQPAAAAPAPAPHGYVDDAAKLLAPADIAALTAKLEAFERGTHHQFVIATVPSIGGHDIAAFADALGNRWGVGRKGVNDGVLLVVAPNERQVRIAVGDGLHAALTDAEANRIIQTVMLPEFRARRMAPGIVRGADAILAQITETTP
nr:TPM domain-containing protein [Sphingomonas sp.]